MNNQSGSLKLSLYLGIDRDLSLKEGMHVHFAKGRHACAFLLFERLNNTPRDCKHRAIHYLLTRHQSFMCSFVDRPIEGSNWMP